MISFIKGILKGLFYVVFFPFGLLAICLYAVFGVFVFVYRLIKLAILFFTGRNLKNELPEDEEVKKILEGTNEEEQSQEPALNLYPSDQEMYNTNEYISPSFEESKIEEEPTPLEEENKDE